MISPHQLCFHSLQNPEKLFRMRYGRRSKAATEREEKKFFFGYFTKAFFGSFADYEACSLPFTHVAEHFSWAYKSNNTNLFCHSFAIPVTEAQLESQVKK
jgi:hypothetical protein